MCGDDYRMINELIHTCPIISVPCIKKDGGLLHDIHSEIRSNGYPFQRLFSPCGQVHQAHLLAVVPHDIILKGDKTFGYLHARIVRSPMENDNRGGT